MHTYIHYIYTHTHTHTHIYIYIYMRPTQTPVEVLSAQVRVATGSHDFKDAVVDSKQGNIEGTTTEVKHQNVLFTLALVVQA